MVADEDTLTDIFPEKVSNDLIKVDIVPKQHHTENDTHTCQV